MVSRDAAIAATRFGIGARPGQLAHIAGDPHGWVRTQIGRGAGDLELFTALPSGAEITIELARLRREDSQEAMRKRARESYEPEAAARLRSAFLTDAPFRERMVWLYADLFTVSARAGGGVDGVIGAYEREAIRPHVFGRFRELLAAAVLHPAMLVYLDAHRSVGPTSAFGARTGKGLNENLAREVLELHTLGVDGGYDQGDVRSFASVLTGWGVDPDTGVAAFRSGAHEPGAKVVYGARVDGVGADEVREVLDALARHEATARHVCTRIARHFVADAPPREAVDALVGTWLATEGDLGAVAVTLVDGPWGWEQAGSKLKSPWEWVVSLGRALGAGEAEQALKALKYLGQRPWDAPSPAGWPDVAAPWIGPEGIARRLELALEVGRRVGEGVDPAALGEAVLGPLWGEGARQAVRAAPGKLALAALLASPDMQRR